MRIAVFGAGGVGCYFGGRLALAGEEVIFIARGPHLRAMRERGLRVQSVRGDFQLDPVNATDTPANVGPVDVVLVTVRGYQVRAAAEAMGPLIAPDTYVVPIQNGLEAADQLTEVLGPEHVVQGTVRCVSFLIEPGLVRESGGEPTLQFAEVDGSSSERLLRLQEAFAKAKVNGFVSGDISLALWTKLLFAGPRSTLATLCGMPATLLQCVPETMTLIEQIVKETAAVGRAYGIALSEDVVQATVENFRARPPGPLPESREVVDRRPLDLDCMIGVVRRRGQMVGVRTPLHDAIYALLLPSELAALGKLQIQKE
jgi:2-dehydropantoate 2-reductase